MSFIRSTPEDYRRSRFLKRIRRYLTISKDISAYYKIATALAVTDEQEVLEPALIVASIQIMFKNCGSEFGSKSRAHLGLKSYETLEIIQWNCTDALKAIARPELKN